MIMSVHGRSRFSPRLINYMPSLRQSRVFRAQPARKGYSDMIFSGGCSFRYVPKIRRIKVLHPWRISSRAASIYVEDRIELVLSCYTAVKSKTSKVVVRKIVNQTLIWEKMILRAPESDPWEGVSSVLDLIWD